MDNVRSGCGLHFLQLVVDIHTHRPFDWDIDISAY